MKGILWYVTRKLEGIFDGILMEFRMRISEDKNQTQKSMYIPRFLSSGLYGIYERSRKKICLFVAFIGDPTSSATPRWEFVVHMNSTQVLHTNSTKVVLK